MTIKSAVLFYNEAKPEAVAWTQKLLKLLKAEGLKVWVADGGSDPPKAAQLLERIKSVDLAIALGGDGTMLRVARVLAPRSVPLLGINTGGLGFLSGGDASDVRDRLKKILAGGYVLEERWMLEVEIFRGSRRAFGPQVALNDCVLRSGGQARAIRLRAHCGGAFVADYFGDGLVISTPTGSTAYALAASGPILFPDLDVTLLAPICPHAVTQRPIVLPATAELSIAVVRRGLREKIDALATLDGQVHFHLQETDEVRVRKYKKPLNLLIPPKRSFFDVLRRKLKWGER